MPYEELFWGENVILPNILAREVERGLKAFIETGFASSTPFFQGIFQRFVEEKGSFIKGPYLSGATLQARGHRARLF